MSAVVHVVAAIERGDPLLAIARSLHREGRPLYLVAGTVDDDDARRILGTRLTLLRALAPQNRGRWGGALLVVDLAAQLERIAVSAATPMVVHTWSDDAAMFARLAARAVRGAWLVHTVGAAVVARTAARSNGGVVSVPPPAAQPSVDRARVGAVHALAERASLACDVAVYASEDACARATEAPGADDVHATRTLTIAAGGAAVAGGARARGRKRAPTFDDAMDALGALYDELAPARLSEREREQMRKRRTRRHARS